MDWWVPVVLVIVLVIILVMYFSPSYSKRLPVNASGPFDLSARKVALPLSESKYILEPQFTAQAFVYMNPAMKTGSHVDCGTDSKQPSCADGSFQPCLCDISGCDRCLNRGFYSIMDLLGVATLEVMPVPDAGRQGAMSTHLYIKTEMMERSGPMAAHNYYIETIPLPALPVQKWVMITIARDGRQFDIYYNDALVRSQKTMFMPIAKATQTNLTGIVSGSDGLGGYMANISVHPTRTTVLTVEQDYKILADTRGAPYLDSAAKDTLATLKGAIPDFGFNMHFKMPKIGTCLTGNCGGPAVAPASNKIWVSGYA